MVTRLRLLEVEVELSNAQQRMAAAKQAAPGNCRGEIARMAGSITNCRSCGNCWRFTDILAPIECTSLDKCLDLAISRRPELKIAELSVSLAREDAKIIRARNLPNVSLDASWVDYQRKYDESELDKEKRNYYTVGVNVTMRPFQGGRNIFAYRKQTLAVQRYQQELVSRNGAVFTEVKSRFQQMVEANSRVLNAEKGLLEAREAYAFADHSAKLGVNSLDDLLTAELRLTQTEINKIEADHSLQQARIQLDYATGNKTPFG